FLRQHRPQPTLQRATPSVRSQLGDALAFADIRAVEVGVEGVSEFAGGGVFARNTQSRLIELFAVAREKNFPSRILAGGTGAGQGQFVDPESQEESAEFALGGASAGLFGANLAKNRNQRFAREAYLLAGTAGMELRQQVIYHRPHGGDWFR